MRTCRSAIPRSLDALPRARVRLPRADATRRPTRIRAHARSRRSAGGYKEYQSTSILGKGAGLPWTSNAVNKMDSRGESKATADMKKQWARMGVKTDKNGNPIQSSAKQVVNEGKKKLFGLF